MEQFPNYIEWMKYFFYFLFNDHDNFGLGHKVQILYIPCVEVESNSEFKNKHNFIR